MKKDSHTWELEATRTFQWCHARSLSRVVGRVGVTQPTSPVNVDLSNVLKDLPRLQLMDKEREKRRIGKEGGKKKAEGRKSRRHAILQVPQHQSS